MRSISLCAAIASAPVWATHAAAQDNGVSTTLIPRTQAQREQLYREEHQIRLNVSVTDASGKPIAGLTPADFTLSDNGAPQKIAAFHAIDPQTRTFPAHVTVVIDGLNSNSSVARVRKDLEKFLSPKLGSLPFPTVLAVLSADEIAESDPSTDRSVLAGQLTQMTKKVKLMGCDQTGSVSDLVGGMGNIVAPGAGGEQEDCASQKFAFSVNLLQKLAENPANARGRGLLVWLGPGWTVPKAAESGQILPGVIRDNYSEPIATVLTELREANVTLDAVSWSNFARTGSPHNAEGSNSGKPASISDLALPALARDSGGLTITKAKDLGDALDSCLADAAQYYSLIFDSKPSAAPDEFHRMEVKVDKPGALVRTATAYYAEP